MKTSNRRTFIKESMVGASLALLAKPSVSNLSRRVDDVASQQKRTITRPLGKTGIELPIVSMGVMRADNPALVRSALKEGLVHLDTAHGYQQGKNEIMLGEVLKEYPRDAFVISTKVPPREKVEFLEMLDVSLERLQMKHVDILYVHGASSRGDILSPETLEAIKSAKESGKTKHVGVSTHKNEPEVILAAIESGVYEVVLTAINFKQDHYQELSRAIAKASEAGIGIIAMKTMAGAFHDRERTKPINCKAALKWVLQDKNVTTAIPGITTFDQLAENASVNTDLSLTRQEKDDLASGQSESGLYCQGCAHCVPQCPRSLPIPEIMRAYMYAYGYGDSRMAHQVVTELALQAQPCSDCGTCSVSCARGFPVAQRITDIARLIDIPPEFLS